MGHGDSDWQFEACGCSIKFFDETFGSLFCLSILMPVVVHIITEPECVKHRIMVVSEILLKPFGNSLQRNWLRVVHQREGD